ASPRAVRAGIVRLERERLRAARQGLLEAPELVERVAAIAQGAGVVGGQRQHLVESHERLFEALELHQYHAAVVVGRDVCGVPRKGGVDVSDGRSVIAALMQGNAQHVQRIEMIRQSLQYLAIDRLGFRQPTGKMQCECRVERWRSRRGRERVWQAL